MRSKLLSSLRVTKKVLKHQLAFVNSTSLYPALVGGLGSGKTDAGIARTLRLKYRNPHLNIAYYMPDYNLIRDRGISGFERELDKIKQPYKTNTTAKTITLEGKGIIFLRTMDNPDKIISYEVADSVIDELDTLPPKKAEYVYRKIRERNRQKKLNDEPNTIANITTPDYGTDGFIYELMGRCINKNTITSEGDYKLLNGGIVGNYHLIEAKTSDNPFLPPSYAKELREMYDPILANLFLNGKMVSLKKDKVYHYFNKELHNTKRVVMRGDYLHIGVDFNVGGCVCTVHIEEGNKVYRVDEFAPRNTDAIVIEINKRYQGHIITFYPDSSGDNESSNASKSDIQILKDSIRTPNSPYFNYPKINGSIRDRINSFNAKIAKGDYLVNVEKCPRGANALGVQGWGKDDKPEKYKDHDGGAVDDYNDSSGYYVVRNHGINKATIGMQKIIRG